MDPRIGMLNRNGKAVFYAFANGYGRPPVEGRLSAVERALRPTPPARKARLRRTYVVTLLWRGADPEEITVEAVDAAEAIKLGRLWKNDEYGRTRSCGTLPCRFRARLAD